MLCLLSDGTCLIEMLILEQKGRESRKAIEVGPEARMIRHNFLPMANILKRALNRSSEKACLLMSFTEVGKKAKGLLPCAKEAF